MDPEAVCVLLPTLDEAGTIGEVVEGFRERGFGDVLVVDGGSTDGTRRVAGDAGARVIEQSGSGKGQAVREGLANVDAPYVLMADGDGTYRPEDAERMLEPLFEGRAEHVIGDRFARIEPGAMSSLNRAGNRLVNRAFAYVHGRNLRDILSGYRAFTRRSVERFTLTAEGFGIETELAVECVRHGVATEVVPVAYRARPAQSETNLRPFRDGARIFATLYRLTKTNNPLFYFGFAGGMSALVGGLLWTFVLFRYLAVGVSHEVVALGGAFAVLLGVQLAMFGVLSDIMVTVNREQTRRIEELTERLAGDGQRAGTRRETPETADGGEDKGLEARD